MLPSLAAVVVRRQPADGRLPVARRGPTAAHPGRVLAIASERSATIQSTPPRHKIEICVSLVHRKVSTPNDVTDLTNIKTLLLAFE
jgi:hypothetical protein